MNFLCPIGRDYDAEHASCRSCERQLGPCIAGKKKRRKKATSQVRTWHQGKTLCTTLFVHGLNAWNNKDRSAYRNIKREWEKVLAGTVFLWGEAKGKRRLTVERVVTSRSHLIADDVNLEAMTKPIEDVLTEQNVLLDDRREYLERRISQRVGPDRVAFIIVEDLS